MGLADNQIPNRLFENQKLDGTTHARAAAARNTKSVA
jgi:hypothetical protein